MTHQPVRRQNLLVRHLEDVVKIHVDISFVQLKTTRMPDHIYEYASETLVSTNESPAQMELYSEHPRPRMEITYSVIFTWNINFEQGMQSVTKWAGFNHY